MRTKMILRQVLKMCVLLVLTLGLSLGLAARQTTQATAAKPLDIYFIDVEGGAATLIVTPQGESVLIDCGWKSDDQRDAKRINAVARQRAGLAQIDHFVVSHFHTDHFGAISQLSQLIPIKKYYDHAVMLPSQEYDKELYPDYQKASAGKRRVLKPGDVIPLKMGSVPLKLICVASDGKVIPRAAGVGAGPNPLCKDAKLIEDDTSDNARSIALLLSFGKFEFLDCGDLTWNTEQKLVCPENLLGIVDLYMVTHHGSETSNNPALVRALQPKVTVMCNGPRKGGHPQTVALLKSISGIRANYQLHRNVETGEQQNTDKATIANWEEKCQGEFIKASVVPDGQSYIVTIGQKGAPQQFEVQ